MFPGVEVSDSGGRTAASQDRRRDGAFQDREWERLGKEGGGWDGWICQALRVSLDALHFEIVAAVPRIFVLDLRLPSALLR